MVKRKGNYKTPFVKFIEEPMGEQPLCVRVAAEVDLYVRSLPNRTEWLRSAIEEKWQRDLGGN